MTDDAEPALLPARRFDDSSARSALEAGGDRAGRDRLRAPQDAAGGRGGFVPRDRAGAIEPVAAALVRDARGGGWHLHWPVRAGDAVYRARPGRMAAGTGDDLFGGGSAGIAAAGQDRGHLDANVGPFGDHAFGRDVQGGPFAADAGVAGAACDVDGAVHVLVRIGVGADARGPARARLSQSREPA